jgi:glycosyltransferase involved in cell wall biosynthesis
MESCKRLAADLELAQHIEFKGGCSKSEWIALSADFDLFISTTRFDNTPVSVIEAMALGMPVVSTNVGGMPFLIDSGKDGMLSEVEDVAEMVRNIKKLLTSTDLASSISAAARQKVSNFDWEVVCHQWLSLLAPNS